MLRRIAAIINASVCTVEGDKLSLSNYSISDLACIKDLDNNGCIDEIVKNNNVVTCDDLSDGDDIQISLSLLHLSRYGYYHDSLRFLVNNKYEIPTTDYFIYDQQYDSSAEKSNAFLNSYSSVVKLVLSIKEIAKHSYDEAGVCNCIIFREDKSLFLPLDYNVGDIKSITTDSTETINQISSAIGTTDLNQKLLFVNELINYLSPYEEKLRFGHLISHASDFLSKAQSAYQYYIRNFSHNKLKADLDNAAIDYSRKIQSVINDAQSKLVAIPAAFILTATNIDFKHILIPKNIILYLSLYVFTILLDIFLRNQFSSLAMIKNNIQVYKESFTNNSHIVINAFSLVDKEATKQNNRLIIIRWITWGIPIVLTIIFIVFLIIQNPIITDTIKTWFSPTIQQ